MLHPLPYQNSYWAFDLMRSTKCHPPFSGVGAFLKSIFHTHLLLLIGHIDRLKVHLSNGRKKEGSASHPLWNNSCVCYLTLLMSAKVDRMVSLYSDDNVYVESAPWVSSKPLVWAPSCSLSLMPTSELFKAPGHGHLCPLAFPQGGIWSCPILSSQNV